MMIYPASDIRNVYFIIVVHFSETSQRRFNIPISLSPLTQACFSSRQPVSLTWDVNIVKSQMAACLWIYKQGDASCM